MGYVMKLMPVVCDPDQVSPEIIRVNYPGGEGKRGSQLTRRGWNS